MVGLFGLAKYRSGSPLLRLEPFGALPFLPGLIPERFLENLARYRKGEALAPQVNLELGY